MIDGEIGRRRSVVVKEEQWLIKARCQQKDCSLNNAIFGTYLPEQHDEVWIRGMPSLWSLGNLIRPRQSLVCKLSKFLISSHLLLQYRHFYASIAIIRLYLVRLCSSTARTSRHALTCYQLASKDTSVISRSWDRVTENLLGTVSGGNKLGAWQWQ